MRNFNCREMKMLTNFKDKDEEIKNLCERGKLTPNHRGVT